MLDALRIVIELKKVKADDLKGRQDTRAPIVGPSSINPWMMFSRVGWLKHQFFLMLGIAKLRSIQYQDADNRISNPTDLAAKLPSNLILIMSDMVRKRWRAGICKDCSLQIQKAHMLCSLHTHLSCSAVSHCMQFRPCGLVPNACLDATFQICLRNRAHLCGQSGAACDSTAFHGLRHFCICRPAPAPAPARRTRYNLCYYFLRL